MCWKKVPLERRAKIAATVDMILATLNLISCSLDLRKSILIEDDASNGEDERNEARLSRYLIIVVLCIATVKLIMGAVLWVGATKRIPVYVRAWLIISILLWLILLTDTIAKLIAGTFLIFTTITTCLTIVVRVIVFFIIVLFIRELEAEENGAKKDGADMTVVV